MAIGRPIMPRAGDAYAHGVFEDIGREAGDDAFGFRAEDFGGFRHAEGDGDGLRAADGRYDLAVDQGDDLFAFRLRYHVCVVLVGLQR